MKLNQKNKINTPAVLCNVVICPSDNAFVMKLRSLIRIMI